MMQNNQDAILETNLKAAGLLMSSDNAEFRTVTVIGLGYIGLPTAAAIASRGMQVLGVDVREDIVKKISSGEVHIYEPDLDGLVQKVVSVGSLRASTKLEPSDVFIIAVPTPVDENKKPVLESIFSATRAIAGVLRADNLVILESTSPVGTTEIVSEMLADMRPDLSFPSRVSTAATVNVAYCPERVLPGRILAELIDNDRSIGGISSVCARRAQRFYQKFIRGACVVTTSRTAEIVKLAENAFRDTNIAFANELSMICDRLEVNVWDVIDLANRHPRVNILSPGPGVGGHCIAVDPWFIIHSAPDLAKLMHEARDTNDRKIGYTIEKASALIDKHPEALAACLGLSFKANIDDLRESPALKVAESLGQRYGARLKIVEPYIERLPPQIAAMGVQLISVQEALAQCKVAIVLVEHDAFRCIPPEERLHLSVLDTKGIWRS